MDGLINFKDYFKKIKRNIILSNYYSKEIKDGKTVRASALDWAFLAIIVMMFFITTTFNTIKSIKVSIILTIILMGVYFFVFINFRNRKRTRKVFEVKENLSNERILKRIEKLNDEEYLLYIKELLEEYYNTKFVEYEAYIDFVGDINGEFYGVKCFRNLSEDSITKKDIENYKKTMKLNKIEYGIIVTNTDFQEGLKEDLDYLLIDFNCMKNILKETGKYPTDEEIEEFILSKYREKKEGLKKDLKAIRKDKVYKFIILGVILYLISSFTAYTLYYKIIGIILISIGAILGTNKLIQYLKLNVENKI